MCAWCTEYDNHMIKEAAMAECDLNDFVRLVYASEPGPYDNDRSRRTYVIAVDKLLLGRGMIHALRAYGPDDGDGVLLQLVGVLADDSVKDAGIPPPNDTGDVYHALDVFRCAMRDQLHPEEIYQADQELRRQIGKLRGE